MKTSYLSGSIYIDTSIVKHLHTIIKYLSSKHNSNALNKNIHFTVYVHIIAFFTIIHTK